MNNKNIIIDTSKINTDIIKEITLIKGNFNKANSYINKIYELKCPEYTSMLEYIKKDIFENIKISDEYISKMNKIMGSFNNLSKDIIKKTSSIEKINTSSLMVTK